MPMKSEEPAGSVLDDDGLVSCGEGTTLKLEAVQPESKKPMSIGEAIRGGYIAAGRNLT